MYTKTITICTTRSFLILILQINHIWEFVMLLASSYMWCLCGWARSFPTCRILTITEASEASCVVMEVLWLVSICLLRLSCLWKYIYLEFRSSGLQVNWFSASYRVVRWKSCGKSNTHLEHPQGWIIPCFEGLVRFTLMRNLFVLTVYANFDCLCLCS